MKNKTLNAEPELSRPVRVEKISPNGVEETIVASPREREALAKRFDLVEVKSLEAKLRVTPKHAGLDFAVTGNVAADVVQRCVASLEPLSTHIDQAIDTHFAASADAGHGNAERDLDEEDMEPIEGGIIDLGELTAQHLGLGLNPYPRKADVPPVEVEFSKSAAPVNPFAKLVVVKNQDKK